jgi:hypothetical protein
VHEPRTWPVVCGRANPRFFGPNLRFLGWDEFEFIVRQMGPLIDRYGCETFRWTVPILWLAHALTHSLTHSLTICPSHRSGCTQVLGLKQCYAHYLRSGPPILNTPLRRLLLACLCRYGPLIDVYRTRRASMNATAVPWPMHQPRVPFGTNVSSVPALAV